MCHLHDSAYAHAVKYGFLHEASLIQELLGQHLRELYNASSEASGEVAIALKKAADTRALWIGSPDKGISPREFTTGV